MNSKITTILRSGASKKVFAALLFCSVFSNETVKSQTTEAYDWSNIAVGGGGFVSGIITSKKDVNLMYARTDVGGAYRYDRSTSKWIPLMDWASDQQQGALGVESLATDFTDARNVYVAAGIDYFNGGKSFILRSTNYGASFTAVDVTSKFKFHGNGAGRQNGERLQVDPNRNSILFVGTRRNGLWKSTDFGVNWNAAGNIPVTTTPNGAGISFVVFDKNSAAVGSATTRMFVGISRAGSNTNFYRSTDGGNTFTAIDNSALPDNLMPQRAVIPGNGFVYVTYGNGAGPGGTTAEPMDQGQIWKFNIATSAWTNITPLSSSSRVNRAFSGISIDPSNSNRLVASTINTYMAQGTTWGDRFYLSSDGGTTWTDIIGSRGFSLNTNGVTWVSNSSIHWAGSIEFDPANTNRVFVTSGNGVFVNEAINTSNVWKFTVNGLEETVPLNLVSIPGGPVLHVVGDYDGFRHTNVANYGPIHTPRMGTTSGLAYGFTNKNKVVRVGNSMYYSNDMGVTWTKTSVINGVKGQVAVSADGNTILHSPEKSSVTYRTTNNGGSWTTVSGLSFDQARPVADGLTTSKFYAYNPSGSFMISTNGGVSFTTATNPGSGGSKVIRPVPGRDGDVWVALYGGGLKYTENSGSSFTTVTKVTYCGAVGIGKSASGASYETIYIWGTVNGILGIHRSTDKGANWVRINDDAHEYGGPGNGQFVVGDMNTYGRVYMSTAGRGVASGSARSGTLMANDGATDRSLINTFEKEQKFTDLQVYPNPVEDVVSVKVAENMLGGSMLLTNSNGVMVYGGKVESSITNISMSAMVPGLYILTIKNNGTSSVSKILKK